MLQCASLYSMRIKKISAPLQGLDLESLKKNKAFILYILLTTQLEFLCRNPTVFHGKDNHI